MSKIYQTKCIAQSIIKLCDRFLEKRRSLSYEQHLIAFASFEQFLRDHTIPYSIPRSFEYSGLSNYQREKAIVEFFRTIKQTIQSLPWSEQSKLREQSLSSTWKPKENLQPKQELKSLSQDALLGLIQEKDNLINLLIRQVETALQRPSFYTHTNVKEVGTMTNNPGGFSVSGSVGGDIHNQQGDNNLQGDNNTQIIQGQGAGSTEEQLTKEQVIELLAKLDKLVRGAELPEDTKEEATMYLGAAKKATEKEEPKKETALANLESVAETLETASKTVDAGKNIWDKAKPIILKVAGWLGAAAGSYLLGL
ncbi:MULTISPECIES: hypothetical protein [unclassified Moorena]|uniref:hypothetical protein n=1 Tax=unclassified Moorena TaxID=2683338 RepID=UPI0013CCFE98|nr:MULTISPECIES: hypothetical protein [unclassified Moorena]NEO21521.1 hypothetical protein [Moorena sp. SIO4A5]NEQ59101.1 hypothetical protein [Moorena sp. SIO4A1]